MCFREKVQLVKSSSPKRWKFYYAYLFKQIAHNHAYRLNTFNEQT